MTKGFVASLPADRRTAAEAPVSGSADSTTKHTRNGENLSVMPRSSVHPRARRSKSKAFRPPASRADGEVLLVRQKYPKAQREHRRPACGRVPSGAPGWRGSPNSLQSLRSFRSDMRRSSFRHPVRASGVADGGASQRPTCVQQGALLQPFFKNGSGFSPSIKTTPFAVKETNPRRHTPAQRWFQAPSRAPRSTGAGGACHDNRAAACLSGRSEATAASSADPTRTEHRREPERSSGAIAGKSVFAYFCRHKSRSHQLAQPAAKSF